MSVELSKYHEHLARAAGNAASFAEMDAAWSLLGDEPPFAAWDVLFDQVRRHNRQFVVALLDKHGKSSDLDIASTLWSAASACLDKDIMAALLANAGFAKLVQTDKTGATLRACLNISFVGQVNPALSSLVRLGPPQEALDQCLIAVMGKSHNASASMDWPRAWKTLVAAGANPFVSCKDKASSPLFSFTPESDLLLTLAKEASRLPGNGASYLANLLSFHHAERILGHESRKGVGFVPMWVAGGGSTTALVEALGKAKTQGSDWFEQDRFTVLPDALRLACTNTDDTLMAAVLSRCNTFPGPGLIAPTRIASIVDQAYRQSLRGTMGECDDLDAVLSQLGDSPRKNLSTGYALHMRFWENQAPRLAQMFTNPQSWRDACETITRSLDRAVEPTQKEIKALLAALDLACATAPASNVPQKPRIRL